jgi:hypothetical protein
MEANDHNDALTPNERSLIAWQSSIKDLMSKTSLLSRDTSGQGEGGIL